MNTPTTLRIRTRCIDRCTAVQYKLECTLPEEELSSFLGEVWQDSVALSFLDAMDYKKWKKKGLYIGFIELTNLHFGIPP